MVRRITIVFVVIITLTLSTIGITSCTNVSAGIKSGGEMNSPDPNYGSKGNNGAPYGVTIQTAEPNINVHEKDYDSFIPDIDFGFVLLAFVQGDSKTYLYTDVKYSDIKKYAESLVALGYEDAGTDASESDDTFEALYFNDETDAYVRITYDNSGLTIYLYFEEE